MTFKQQLQMIEDYALYCDEPFVEVPEWYRKWWEQEHQKEEQG